MSHWSDQYVDLPYIEGEFDCGDLAEKVQREVFGREVQLPVHAEGLRAQSRQIQTLRDDFAESITTPSDGDAVLMKSGPLFHIGIYYRHNEIPHVLHAVKSYGRVVRHKLRDLPHRGLVIEGYYTWK